MSTTSSFSCFNPLIAHYSLDQDLFEPNRDYSNWVQASPSTHQYGTRGGKTYYPPFGYVQLGLNVLDKYPNDDQATKPWLDEHRKAWPVAYVHLESDDIGPILREHFNVGGLSGLYRVDPKYGSGIQVTPYATTAEKGCGDGMVIHGDRFNVIAQMRVRPGSYTDHGEIWVIGDQRDARIYKICYKRV